MIHHSWLISVLLGQIPHHFLIQHFSSFNLAISVILGLPGSVVFAKPIKIDKVYKNANVPNGVYGSPEHLFQRIFFSHSSAQTKALFEFECSKHVSCPDCALDKRNTTKNITLAFTIDSCQELIQNGRIFDISSIIHNGYNSQFDCSDRNCTSSKGTETRNVFVKMNSLPRILHVQYNSSPETGKGPDLVPIFIIKEGLHIYTLIAFIYKLMCQEEASGHFVAYTVNKKNWHYCNDSTVHQVGGEEPLITHVIDTNPGKWLQQAFYTS